MEGVLRGQSATYLKQARSLVSGGALRQGLDSDVVFPFTDGDFARVRELIHHQAGISLAQSKMDLVYSRLARRLRARAMDTFADYLTLVESGDEQEVEAFINALTTNMTSFFREPHHFRLLAHRLSGHPAGRPLAIWTCACSSGEEPYSIAMTAYHAFGRAPSSLQILATDINTAVLAKAKEGIYAMEQLQKVPPKLLKRFFLRGQGKREGLGCVKDELKDMITFRRMNLLEERWPMRESFDVIFCRNVMIYFDKPTQREVLNRLAAHLKQDGLLFLGHSESLHGDHLFKNRGQTVYALKG